MSIHVLHREWLSVKRDGRVRGALALMLLLMFAAFVSGLSQARAWQAEAGAAAELDRQQWLGLGRSNPHDGAHFGQYAFKPTGALAWFDPGINDYVGRGVWMEAHTQTPAVFRPADEGDALTRFGALSGALVLQLGLPLVILLAGFVVYAGERESGALKLQLANGAGVGALFAGKALMLVGVAAAVLAPFVISLMFAADESDRALLAVTGYLLYALAWVGLTLAVSASLREARSALAVLLGLWLLSTLIVPRVAADLAENRYPSPDPQTFWREVRDAQSKGIDGHNPANARTQALLAATLQKYGVEREEDLPISFAGISMQAAEEFGNQVYDHYYGQLWATYAAQDGVRAGFALLSPVLPTQALSQSAAASDWRHHRHFAERAETHRRDIQRFMNAEFAAKAKGLDFDYRAEQELWARAPQWRYQPPSLAQLGASPGLALGSLLAWALAIWTLAFWQARRLCYGALT